MANFDKSDLRYRNTLIMLYACVWIFTAINPHYFADWLLENVLVFVVALVFALTANGFCFSKLSNTLIFIFMCLHSIGAHYTYSLVPYDAWVNAMTGSTFNELVGWSRNNFDRLVHFSFGLLLAYPLRQLLMQRAGLGQTAWSYLLPVLLIISASTAFELIEWSAAIIFGGDLGQAYLGTQGDEWDSHKDTVLASLGSLVSMTVTLLYGLIYSVDRVTFMKVAKNFRFS